MNLFIIIVGGNNISNYALVKYFRNPKERDIPKYDKVMFIYTKFSQRYFDKFKQLLKDIEIIELFLEEKYEDDLNYVENRVLEELNKLKLDSIHLNYTGGRKPMSIGTFLAVDKYEKCKNKIFSDISPKDYKLRLRRGDIYPQEGSLSDNINLSIKEFFILHGNDEPIYENEVSEFYSEEFVEFLIQQNLQEENIKRFYSEVWDKEFKELKNLNWKEALKNAPISFSLSTISNKKLKKLQEFIRGRFLEEYIFSILQEMKKELQLSDIGWNVKNGKNAKFEVDIIAIKGYKSFTFSCTTADKKNMVKGKLFEAQYRAEQIGGIKNMPISISFANKKTIEELKKDLVNKEDKSIAQFIGIEEIKDKIKLKQRLKEIIK